MHDIEIKVRLSDRDATLLRNRAKWMGIPVSALARVMVKQGLRRQTAQGGFENGMLEAPAG